MPRKNQDCCVLNKISTLSLLKLLKTKKNKYLFGDKKIKGWCLLMKTSAAKTKIIFSVNLYKPCKHMGEKVRESSIVNTVEKKIMVQRKRKSISLINGRRWTITSKTFPALQQLKIRSKWKRWKYIGMFMLDKRHIKHPGYLFNEPLLSRLHFSNASKVIKLKLDNATIFYSAKKIIIIITPSCFYFNEVFLSQLHKSAA